MKKIIRAVLSASLFASVSMAEPLAPVTSDKADQGLYGTGALGWVGQKDVRIGYDTTNNLGGAYVMVFALPTLPDGETVKSATLAINVLAPQGVFGGEADWNIDVYGVRGSSSSKVLAADFFEGDNDANSTKVIEDFIAVKGTAPAAVGPCDAGKNAAFGAWLQTLYEGNTPKEKYAFVRLNSDVAFANYKNTRNPALQNTSRFLKVGTGDNDTAAARPTLTIITGTK
jgi:hypothetical protein